MKKLNGTVIVTYRSNARCNMCNRYKKPSLPDDVFYQYYRRRALYTDRFKGYCEGIKEKE